jgi:serine/threonine-protein kinase
MELQPASSTACNNLAGFYSEKLRRTAAAEPLYRRVIELAPGSPMGYRSLGFVFLLMGRCEEAAAQSQRSLEIEPTSAGYTNLGAARYCQGRYAEAVAAFAKAAELEPKDYRHWGNLGDAYANVPGQGERARDAWRRCLDLARGELALNAGDPLARSRLALCEARLGHTQAALDGISKALRSGAKDPAVMLRSAMVYQIGGERRKALAALKAALELGESKETIRHEPAFAGLRRDPQCSEIISEEVCNGH